MGLGRQYVIREYQQDMDNSSREIARIASAITQTDSLSSWVLRMNVSSVANATGNQIVLTDPEGIVVCCSDKETLCEHIGMVISSQILQSAAEGRLEKLSDLDGFFKTRRYVSAQPILAHDEQVLGYVFVSNLAGNMLGAWTTVLTLAAGIAVVVYGIEIVFFKPCGFFAVNIGKCGNILFTR